MNINKNISLLLKENYKELKKIDTEDFDIEELKKSFILDLEGFYADGKNRHEYSEISNFVRQSYHYDNDVNNDDFNYFIEFIENIKYPDNILKNAIKLIDHLKLERDRAIQLAQFDSEVRELIKENIEQLEKKSFDLDEQIKNSKANTLTITSLVFSGFTAISINASIFAAASEKFNELSNVMVAIAGVNLLLILTVFTIYTIIRRIHGSIKDQYLYLTIGVVVSILIGIIIYFN